MLKHVCKHLDGFGIGRTCKEGINIREHVGGPDLGWLKRMPCFETNKDAIPCDKYQGFTDEEIQEIENGFKEIEERHRKLEPLIIEIKMAHKNQNWQGIVVCPICQGKLHVQHSGCNGHVWGKCETENCVSWME